MIDNKINFLQKDLFVHLRLLDSATPPLWGKMSLQQMIEHFADAVRIASGKTPQTKIITPDENLPSMQDF